MVRSKDVLAVMGLLCVNAKFRESFFKDPRNAAVSFVGALSDDELKQIDNLAGKGKLPKAYAGKPDKFIEAVKGHYKNVCDCYDCPAPPCPDCPDY